MGKRPVFTTRKRDRVRRGRRGGGGGGEVKRKHSQQAVGGLRMAPEGKRYKGLPVYGGCLGVRQAKVSPVGR